MDKDLETLVGSFSGYDVQPWMQAAYKALAEEVQKLREVVRASQDNRADPYKAEYDKAYKEFRIVDLNKDIK